MVATVTFPQSGDQDDAEHFASMIGVSNIMDYVESGGGFTPDHGVPEVSISDTTAYISSGNQTTSSSGETIRETGEMVQVEGSTVSLTDSATNHIYIEPDFGSDDNAGFSAYTNTSNASSDALKIGEIDTSSDTHVLYNRAPSIVSASQFTVIDHTDDGNTLLDLTSSGPLDLHVDARFQNIGGTPTFSGHDHTSGGMSTVPNSGLDNSSTTINSGDGIKGGGSVSLGSSLTLDIDPEEFATTEASGDISDGDGAIMYQDELEDSETIDVLQATFTTVDGQALPTGTDLVIVTLDGAGGSTLQNTVLDGDGSTILVDQTGDPLQGYTNTSGGTQQVALVADNGQYGSGSGGIASIYASAKVRVN